MVGQQAGAGEIKQDYAGDARFKMGIQRWGGKEYKSLM